MGKPQTYIRADHLAHDFVAEALDVQSLGAQAVRAMRKALLGFSRRAAKRGRSLGRRQQRAASQWRAVAEDSRRAARIL
ncbi:MAG: hypothetical protein AUG51_09450 [Acidobacteria bacterium 13_1_20CM_3_53_8]|nr:MAG: hypothetical protein AUG51_09450 [Acidobacteria bacterium 13_1_20CM_3_53_8]